MLLPEETLPGKYGWGEGGNPIQGRALDSRVGLKFLLLDKTLKENELKR